MADIEQSLGPRDRVQIKLNLGNSYSFFSAEEPHREGLYFLTFGLACTLIPREERGHIGASAGLRKQVVIFF